MVLSLAPKAKIGRITQPQSTSQWRQGLADIKASTVKSIVDDAKQGDLEALADLFSHMMMTDTQVRSVVMTRIMGVASAEKEIVPARSDNEALAEAGAEMCRILMEDTDGMEDRIADLLTGSILSTTSLEIEWVPNGKFVLPRLHFIHPRDNRYSGAWDHEIRTYDDGYSERWLKVADFKNRFLVHAPHNFAEQPSCTGEIFPVVWAWFFKRILEKYRLSGLERMANGMLYGILPPNALEGARDALLEGLESMSADGVAIFEEGVQVTLQEMTKNPGEAWTNAIDKYNGEIAKSILGSGLNTEVTHSGGNRALAESMADQTMLPRAIADARRVAQTLKEGLFEPFLKFNAHITGGQVAPAPTLKFKLVNDEPIEIDQILIDTQAVTYDELRESRGLEPWGPERGGDQVVKVAAPEVGSVLPTGELSQGSGGNSDPVPLSKRRKRRPPHQLSLTFPIASQTPSACETSPLKVALLNTLDGQEP